MRARVDEDLCIGCGVCPEVCPEVFAMENDKAVVIVDHVPTVAEADCRQAAEECPVTAITVTA